MEFSIPFFLPLPLRQNQVQSHADECGEANSGHADVAHLQHGTADAGGEDQRYDDEVAGIAHVGLVVDHVVDSRGCNHSKKKQHDSAQHGAGDGSQEGAHLTNHGEGDSRDGRDANHHGVGNFSEDHRTRHLRVGGYGRSPNHPCHAASNAVAQHGTVHARVLHKVFLGHLAHRVHVAHVFNHGGYRHGNHKQDGPPRELGLHELRKAKPRGGGDTGEVDSP